uniref:NET domain-containing protein n=1 Tax=Macrostomum lignano TaxID=282301 RepID=A0A1I8J1C9_9PLAT
MNAKHLEQLPLQPDSATLPPSDTLIVAEELPSPTGNNAADQQEREVRQSMFETLKQLELEDDDANELLGSLVAEGPAALENAADVAANRRKPTPEELWEVIHGFRAMLEEKKQQQQQQPKRQQASALVRASSIPDGLCSLQQFKQPQ